jgi:hypothetical protein
MKKPSAEVALLTPDAEGWRLSRTGAAAQKTATLGEAAAALPLGTRLHLALPCQAVLLERMTLPSTDRSELAGMVQLQLEKSLPFAIEDVSSDFVVVESGENESTLVSAAAQNTQLDSLCGPLRESGRVPEKITPFAMHVAAACPANETVLAIYPEQGQLVVAICEKSRLAWTHLMQPMPDEAALRDELPQMLLGAEMEGVPTNFSRVRLAEESASLAGPLREYFEVPVELMPLDGQLPEPSFNLVPASWQADVARGARLAQWKQRIVIGVGVYLLLIVASYVYLALLKVKAGKLAAEVKNSKPAQLFMQTRKARWNALAPAVDPNRYVVEVLFQVTPPADSGISITEFDFQPAQWRVAGEAPSANLLTNYVAKLKEDKELEPFTIEWKMGAFLPNDHVPFNIFGKQ